MLIHRRSFLIGAASLLAAPAIVRATSIMPVRALPPVLAAEPWVNGIRWQSYPFGTTRPPEFAQGSIGYERGLLRPLSSFTERMDWHRKIWPNLQWQPMPVRSTKVAAWKCPPPS